MPYAQNNVIELVSLQKFMELDAFSSIIESMYEIDLNHASMRRQAQLRITQMYKQIPIFAGNLRFPEKYHVNLSTGRIADSLRQLVKVMVMLGKDDDDDSVKKFYSVLDELIGHVFRLDQEKLIEAGIYSRASFEEKFGFSWNN